ncbi:hypothetical protein [uncultured Bacteroides sp.]|uniref:hypothetical protein n=1 Tax=uncultured Bacteroides sp. TaxID=162156 RepID=UPI002AA68A93|nr:hypothetical protein [uncultured Bacteroides sp.]
MQVKYIGHVLAAVIGGAEVIDGGGKTLTGGSLAVGGSGTGVAIPVGGAIAAGGAVEAGHGMMVMAKAVNNISKVGSTSGNVQNSPKNSRGIGSKNNAKGDKMGSNTRANK